jgi:hypothetical protein
MIHIFKTVNSSRQWPVAAIIKSIISQSAIAISHPTTHLSSATTALAVKTSSLSIRLS